MKLQTENPSVQESETPETPETAVLLHELRVHQIELELQNEELRRATDALNASRARYMDLYDQAPIGYCSVNEDGLIVHANLTLCTLLGVERSALVSQPPFASFVFRPDQESWYRLRMQSLQRGVPMACELRLRQASPGVGGGESMPVWVQLTVTLALHEDGTQVRHIAVTPIAQLKNLQETLLQQNTELSLFNTVAVDRELVMIELKQQVNALSRQLGLAAPYDVGFADARANVQP